MRQTISRPPVYRISLIQLGLSVLIALLFLLRSPEAGISALVGGLICALPNAVFIYKSFLHTGVRQAKAMMLSFYQGESWKIFLTGVGFAMAFKFIQPLDVLALFTGFILVQCTNLFVSKITNL